jgi:parallel beta-helix repeat protein
LSRTLFWRLATTILHNILNACVRGIHLDGSEANIVESNIIVGSAGSSRGVHIEGAADFNHVRDNSIRDIQLASPGYGVHLDATGVANQVANNIFSGLFGSEAIKGEATVPATTQVLGNQTIGVSPPGARLTLADLGGATGIGNT